MLNQMLYKLDSAKTNASYLASKLEGEFIYRRALRRVEREDKYNISQERKTQSGLEKIIPDTEWDRSADSRADELQKRCKLLVPVPYLIENGICRREETHEEN